MSRITKEMSKENIAAYTVTTTLTFFETMVGGTPDAGLPVQE